MGSAVIQAPPSNMSDMLKGIHCRAAVLALWYTGASFW
jgi:hypothetical protein